MNCPGTARVLPACTSDSVLLSHACFSPLTWDFFFSFHALLSSSMSSWGTEKESQGEDPVKTVCMKMHSETHYFVNLQNY